jgi:hypothetical protein
MSEDRVIDRPAEDAGRRGIVEHSKILLLVETHEREALADIGNEEKSLVAARAPGGDSHAGEGAVDFGKAVQATARLSFLAADKKIEAAWWCACSTWNTATSTEVSRNDFTWSPRIPAIALLADITERFRGFIGGHGLAGAEDPDALLLLQR